MTDDVEGKEVGGDPPVTPDPEPEPVDKIAMANAAAERMEKANLELGALLNKQERLKVERTLGGSSDAGSQKKSKEALAQEEAEKYLKGTGLEDHAFPKEEGKK